MLSSRQPGVAGVESRVESRSRVEESSRVYVESSRCTSCSAAHLVERVTWWKSKWLRAEGGGVKRNGFDDDDDGNHGGETTQPLRSSDGHENLLQ